MREIGNISIGSIEDLIESHKTKILGKGEVEVYLDNIRLFGHEYEEIKTDTGLTICTTSKSKIHIDEVITHSDDRKTILSNISKGKRNIEKYRNLFLKDIDSLLKNRKLYVAEARFISHPDWNNALYSLKGKLYREK